MDIFNQMQHIRFFCEDISEILLCVKIKSKPKAANSFFVNTRFVNTHIGTDDNIYETLLFF